MAKGTAVSLSQISGGGWTSLTSASISYTSADAPTYVVYSTQDLTYSLSNGMKMKFDVSGSTMYSFVTNVGAWSGSVTALTLYCGTDYSVPNAAISNVSYSTQKAPLGFPLDPSKWTVKVTDVSNRSQASPSPTTWYNLGSLSLSVPIGLWNISYTVLGRASSTSNYTQMFTALSTSASAVSNTNLKAFTDIESNCSVFIAQFQRNDMIITMLKTAYYLIANSSDGVMNNIAFRGDLVPTTIRAVCAYL